MLKSEYCPPETPMLDPPPRDATDVSLAYPDEDRGCNMVTSTPPPDRVRSRVRRKEAGDDVVTPTSISFILERETVEADWNEKGIDSELRRLRGILEINFSGEPNEAFEPLLRGLVVGVEQRGAGAVAMRGGLLTR